MTTNKLNRPCAVELDGLTKKQSLELQEMFLKDGARLSDDIEGIYLGNWNYWGIDWKNETQLFDNLSSFWDDSDVDDEVTLYTYDEVVSLMSCNDDTTISDVQATKVPPKGGNISESNTEGFKEVVESSANISIKSNISFDVTIKGQTFSLTKEEVKELYLALCSAEGEIQDWGLGE